MPSPRAPSRSRAATSPGALVGALWDRPVYVRKIGRDAVHARDPDLLRALLEGDALITALEGETWMGHASPSVPGAPRPPSGAI